MNATLIEWALNPDGTPGYTLNSKTGCLNHTPEGLCLGGNFPCYAYRLANGRLRDRYLTNGRVPEQLLYRATYFEHKPSIGDPFFPRWWPERLKIPEPPAYKGYSKQARYALQQNKRKGIFLDDMSDWMGDYWPKEWTEAELQMMRDCPQHRFYTLTKQPQNLLQFSPFPPNCEVGVTATGYGAFNKALDYLKYIEAKIKFISIEPLLEAIPFYSERLAYCGINQLIIGACTGTLNDLKPLLGDTKYLGLTLMPYGKRWTLQPKIEHVEEIVRAADRAGVPVFIKDNLVPLLATDPRPEKAKLFYSEMGLRQEVPG